MYGGQDPQGYWQNPQGYGQNPQQQDPYSLQKGPGGGAQGGQQRPKLTAMQIFCVCLSFVLLLGWGGAAYAASQNSIDKITDQARGDDFMPRPEPSRSTPEAPPSPSATPGEDDDPPPPSKPGPSQSKREREKAKTAKERGPLTVNDNLSKKVRMGGPTAKRTKTKEGTNCLDVINPKMRSKYKKIFKKHPCESYVQGSYVSEKKDVYISNTAFQFKDYDTRDAAKDEIDLNDGPVKFMRPSDSYGFSRINSKTGIYTTMKSQSEVMVLTTSLYADGRSPSDSENKDLKGWDNLLGGDLASTLIFDDM